MVKVRPCRVGYGPSAAGNHINAASTPVTIALGYGLKDPHLPTSKGGAAHSVTSR